MGKVAFSAFQPGRGRQSRVASGLVCLVLRICLFASPASSWTLGTYRRVLGTDGRTGARARAPRDTSGLLVTIQKRHENKHLADMTWINGQCTRCSSWNETHVTHPGIQATRAMRTWHP